MNRRSWIMTAAAALAIAAGSLGVPPDLALSDLLDQALRILDR
jgi:hypothetical protein